MKIIHDIKSISAKRRELLRKEAYEAFQSGITGHSFARTHKIYPETVYSWYRKFKVHGEEAVKEQKRGKFQKSISASAPRNFSRTGKGMDGGQRNRIPELAEKKLFR